MLLPEQKDKVLRAMEPYMAPDQYGRTTIRNIYCDTDNYRLIRRSIERPADKEKLRIRSYEQKCGDGRGSGRGFQPGAVPADRTMRAEIPGKRISEKN